jgi:quinol monooxygenase YgiN
MPTVVATIKVKADKIEEAKTFLKALSADTLANESGTLAYTMHQQRDDPQTFIVYEKYEDDAAFAEHGKNLASKGGDFAALMEGAPQIVMMEEL